MNTAAVKKASYASRQNRGGPAPLASFEDLPSDEMDSPSSLAGNTTAETESLNERLNDDCSTPGTILCSPISALRLDVQDVGSQLTLMPCLSLDGITEDGSPCQTPSYQLEGSKDSLATSRQGGSALHLSVEGEKSLIEGHRKSSWTDLFRPRSRSHSPQSSPHLLRKSSGNIASVTPLADDGSKKKKGFLSSIFKFHDKKSSKGVKPDPQVKPEPAPSNVTVQSSEPKPETTEQAVIHSAPPVPPTEASVAVSSLQNNQDKVQNQSEAVPLCLLSDFTNEVYDAKVFNASTNDDIGSLESDLVSEGLSEKEVDIEAETLLAQESVDYDEYLALQGSSEFLPIEPPSQQQEKPRRQRLEITTVPIERPRSTTPINVAPFEAFVQSSVQSASDTDKLKVLLPNDAFNRPKSPKKPPPQSWQDFCQAGLHSPRLPKRNSDDDMTPDDDLCQKDSLTPSKEMWETFEVSLENKNVTKEMQTAVSNSSSFSSSCDSNSAAADLFDNENNFPQSFPSFHSSEKIHDCTDTNSENQETSRKSPS